MHDQTVDESLDIVTSDYADTRNPKAALSDANVIV